jgi:uncharacterized protein (TIGR00290 family)
LISKGATNEEYETKFIEACSEYRNPQARAHLPRSRVKNDGAEGATAGAIENQSHFLTEGERGNLENLVERSNPERIVEPDNLEGVVESAVPDTIVFGDLFLADIRNYRDQFLARHNLRGLYPVWLRDTTEFIKEFIALGFKAIVTCTDAKILGSDFAGRVIDEAFLAALPPQVDPCGENGEFHTFVFDGPNFKRPVAFSKGEIVQRDGFWFCDLLPE